MHDLASGDKLNGDWASTVRPALLWAAVSLHPSAPISWPCLWVFQGLRDLEHARPGHGYTGHCFNDFNHVDATTMEMANAHNENDGAVRGIAIGNQLGPGIRAASLPELVSIESLLLQLLSD